MQQELLPRLIGRLPSECSAKLTELHRRLPFTDNDIDAFEVNQGTLTAENIPVFQAFLEESANAAKQQLKLATTPSQGEAGAKRARLGFSTQGALLRDVGAAFGRSATRSRGSIVDVEATTPVPKRLREARGDGAEVSTPECPRKQLKVSLKLSLNEGIAVKGTGLGVATAPVKLEVLGDPKLWTGPRRGTYTWMDEALEDRATERDRRLVELEVQLAEAMKRRHLELEDVVVGVIGVPAQAEAILCGRVVCEGLEGKLNERSILIEGSRETAKGARMQLNVTACPSIAAFPGQLVAVLGRSGTAGTTFHARDFIAGLPAPPPATLVAPGCNELLHMLVAAGPYCLRDGLDYCPLEKALEYAAKANPQVLVLLGPFVDANNKLICDGDAQLEGEAEPCSFEEVYTKCVLRTLRRGIAALRRSSPSTQVLLVPSLEEVLCFHPMPQPPLDVALGPSLGAGGEEQFKELGAHFLPNPAHLQINGLSVTITSADALTPVLRSGLVLRPDERKIEQALRLLQQQRSLFPVVPREPAVVSEARAAALDFPGGSIPDVCIFPSASGTASGTFVDGRLFVNPGSLCRPAAYGTFAEIWLAPPPADGSNASLLARAQVDIQSFNMEPGTSVA